MNFKVFVKTAIYDPIMLMPIAWYRHQNKRDFSLFECWLPLFIWQIVIDINFKMTLFPSMILYSRWYLLRNGVIKIGKFLFTWSLLLLLIWKADVYMNCRVSCRKNCLWTYNHVNGCCVMSTCEQKIRSLWMLMPFVTW